MKLFKIFNGLRQFRKELSFTLIEIMVSIFIIMLFSAIVLVNYRQSGRKFVLQRSANKLAQDIRRAAEAGMSAEKLGGGGEVPPGGYGIYLNQTDSTTSYIFFADSNKNSLYDSGEMIREINLEKGVKIIQLAYLGKNWEEVWKNVTNTDLSIVFQPSEPTVWIASASDTKKGRIALIYLETDGEYRLIEVNSSGLIEIKTENPVCYCGWKETGRDPSLCADNPPVSFSDLVTYECTCNDGCPINTGKCYDIYGFERDEGYTYSYCVSGGTIQ